MLVVHAVRPVANHHMRLMRALVNLQVLRRVGRDDGVMPCARQWRGRRKVACRPVHRAHYALEVEPAVNKEYRVFGAVKPAREA